MSSRPEEEEPIDEIEEGEIVSEEDEEIDLTDEDDYEINDDDEDEDNMDIAGLMTSLLATPDGDTVCSALVNICYQLETQNKILIKMLSKIQPPKSA
jgi:hypothetical protein